eukprot:SAG22_NODE_77_length_22125_cov_46.140016_25_plen_181_part_00
MVQLEYNLGMLCAKLQKLKCGVAHLRKAIAKSKPPVEPVPRWHNDLAAVLEGAGRLAEALAASEAAVAADPAAEKFRARRARLLRRLQESGGEDVGVDRETLALVEAQKLEAAGLVDEAYDAYTELAEAAAEEEDGEAGGGEPTAAAAGSGGAAAAVGGELLYLMAWNRFRAEDYYAAHR